jgi:EmrB/QacA subfamily drug resistance transporter
VALALLCVAQFIDVLGVTVVVVALPSIGADLGASPESLQPVVTAYALCFGGFLVLGGRAADSLGRRRVFSAGLVLFAVASLVAGLAEGSALLIAARALQGVAAAAVVPAALSMVTSLYPEGPGRTRALAVWTAVAATGGALGFVLGGIVTDAVGWEWLFFANVPIAVVALALTPALLGEEAEGERSSAGLDLVGALLLSGGLGALILAADEAGRDGAGATSIAIPAVLGVALLIGFVLAERRVRAPLVPPGTFANRGILGGNLVAFALTAVTSSAGVLATLYAQDLAGLSAAETGLALMPFSAGVVGGSFVGHRTMPALGERASMAVGLGLVGAAMLVVALAALDGTVAVLSASLAVAGVGLGLAAVASTSIGTASADPEDRGLASGLLNTSTQLGTALGVAALVALASVAGDLLDGIELAYVAAAAMAAVACAAVLLVLRGSERA